MFTYREIIVNEIPIHVVEAGSVSNPSVFFIHGWPTCWLEFEGVMNYLAAEYHVIAIDIPGIGNSVIPLKSYSKRNIAEYVRGIMDNMNLHDVTLVGCDAGGQVTYAFLKSFPDRLSRAVIMNVAIPGVDPWNEVKSNPYIWHFAFHNVPELPEILISGKELPYFSFFYDVLAGKGKRLSGARRRSYVEAYSRAEALKAGFDLYRCFIEDEKDNTASKNVIVTVPVLYLRGSNEYVNIEKYIAGFRENSLQNINAMMIEDCGHFSAEEQPEQIAEAIRKFIRP